MKRYKNPWKKPWSFPSDSETKIIEKPEIKVIESKNIEEKIEEKPFQIDSKKIADLISKELKQKINNDKLLFFLIFGMGILAIFVIVIAIISLIISIQASSALNKLSSKL